MHGIFAKIVGVKSISSSIFFTIIGVFFYSVLLDWTTTHEDDNSILWKFAMLYFWVKRYHLHYLGFKRLSKFLPKYIRNILHIFINMFLIYCRNYVFLKVKENDQVTILNSLSIYFFLQSQSWFICIGTIFLQFFAKHLSSSYLALVVWLFVWAKYTNWQEKSGIAEV